MANALDGAGKRVSDLVIPRCTYTDPEVAQVGITPQEAVEQGIAINNPPIGVGESRTGGDRRGGRRVCRLVYRQRGHRWGDFYVRPCRRVPTVADPGGDAEDGAVRVGSGDPLLPHSDRGNPAGCCPSNALVILGAPDINHQLREGDSAYASHRD